MSLHLKVGSDFIHHLEGLIKSVFHGLAHQGAAEVKGALETIKGHAEDTLAQVVEKAENAQGDMFHLQSHQAAEPEQANKNSNQGTEKANLGVDEEGTPLGGPTSVAPLGASVAAQNIQEEHVNQHAPDAETEPKTESSAATGESEAVEAPSAPAPAPESLPADEENLAEKPETEPNPSDSSEETKTPA
jgi:hypothetical protein